MTTQRSLQMPSPRAAPRGPQHAGFTLYEVVLSVAILLASLAALSYVIDAGSRASIRSERQTKATLLARSKMAEILAGVEPMQAVSDVPFEGTATTAGAAAGSNWAWSLQLAAGPHPDLLLLELTVSYVGNRGRAEPVTSLRRYVRDPQVFIDAANREAQLQAQQQSGSSTGGTL